MGMHNNIFNNIDAQSLEILGKDFISINIFI